MGSIRLWNYNRAAKGVKEVELLYRGRLVWSGTVNRGTGNPKSNFSTTVMVRKEAAEPTEEKRFTVSEGSMDIVREEEEEKIVAYTQQNPEKQAKKLERAPPELEDPASDPDSSVPIWLSG